MEIEHDIRFETKERGNERRLQEALERTPHERFLFFLKLCEEMQFFNDKSPHPNRAKNNFVININWEELFSYSKE